MSSSVNKFPSFAEKRNFSIESLQEKQRIALCIIASSVDTYIVIHHVRSLIKLSRRRFSSALPREGPSRQLSVRRDATVSCIKDGHKTNAHFAFYCVRYSWESQKSTQIPRIRTYFKLIPSRVRVMPGSAIPGWNRVSPGTRPTSS